MSERPERLPLDRYLDRICRRLWLLSPRERRETREELRQHLQTLAAHAARTVESGEAMEDAMKKFGDPKHIGSELSRQHLRRRRWLSALLKTAAGTALTLTVLVVGYGSYWYFALSQPMPREPAPTPILYATATLAAIQTAQDGYARQIHSVRFQSDQAIHAYYEGHSDKIVTHTYQVAAKGNRYFSREVADDRYGDGLDETTQSEDITTSDGKTMRDLLTQWSGAAGSPRAEQTRSVSAYLRDNNHKPYDPDEMLQYGYKVHDAWVGDVLRRGKPTIEGTVTDPQFGQLTVVRCRNKSLGGVAETVHLWLAPRLGWLAVKTETEQTSISPNLPVRQINKTRAVAKAGPLWVTTEGNLQVDYAALGHRQQLINRPRRFADIAFNDVPDSLFDVHYPVGTRYWGMGGQQIKVSILRPYGRWEEQPPMNSPGIVSLWPFLLAGVVLLGGTVSFAMTTLRRRGRRLPV